MDELSPYADIAYGPSLDDPTDSDSDLSDPLAEIKQNFKILLLTRPGEKLDEPEFGIGIQNFLFEMNTIEIKQQISSRIKSQVITYLSSINIVNIDLSTFENNENGVYVAITYYVPQINQQDRIVVNFPENS
jgi:phage baseplate assembly protein W